MIYTVGKFVAVETTYRGANSFPVADVRLEVANGRQTSFTAVGAEAEMVNALLSHYPVGNYVAVTAHPVFNESSSTGRTYMTLQLDDLSLQGNVGSVDSNFRLQGFIGPLTEREGRNGKFFTGDLKRVAFQRDGTVLTGAAINMIVPEELHALWQQSEGKMAVVSGVVEGRQNSNNGRVYATLKPVGIGLVLNVPAWLEEYAKPAETEAESDENEEEAVPF